MTKRLCYDWIRLRWIRRPFHFHGAAIAQRLRSDCAAIAPFSPSFSFLPFASLFGLISLLLPTYFSISSLLLPTYFSISSLLLPTYFSISSLLLPTYFSISSLLLPTYFSISSLLLPTYFSISSLLLTTTLPFSPHIFSTHIPTHIIFAGGAGHGASGVRVRDGGSVRHARRLAVGQTANRSGCG
jgi:hypothetical protein